MIKITWSAFFIFYVWVYIQNLTSEKIVQSQLRSQGLFSLVQESRLPKERKPTKNEVCSLLKEDFIKAKDLLLEKLCEGFVSEKKDAATQTEEE